MTFTRLSNRNKRNRTLRAGDGKGEQSEAMSLPFLSPDPSVSLYIFYPIEEKRAYAQIIGEMNLGAMRMLHGC